MTVFSYYNCQALAREVLEKSRNEQEEIKMKELEESISKLRVSGIYMYCLTSRLRVFASSRLGIDSFPLYLL